MSSQTNTPTERETIARIIYEGPMIWAVDHAHQAEGQRVWVPHGNSYAQDEARKAADAILARPTPVKAEVVEPTEAMIEAGYDATRLPDGTPQFAEAGFCLGHAVAIYRAMRAAAPQAPAPIDATDRSQADAEYDAAIRAINRMRDDGSISPDPAPCDPVSGEGVKTYRVGDFIGRNPVLCIHGHIDPNNLCPLCEGYEPERDDPPTPTANEALEGAVRKALRILHNGDLHEITRVVDAQDALHAALQTTASTPGVTEEAVNAAEKAWMSSMAPDLTEEQLGWLFLDDRHRSALKAALKAALAAPAKGE